MFKVITTIIIAFYIVAWFAVIVTILSAIVIVAGKRLFRVC
jgi:hypothetical protein